MGVERFLSSLRIILQAKSHFENHCTVKCSILPPMAGRWSSVWSGCPEHPLPQSQGLDAGTRFTWSLELKWTLCSQLSLCSSDGNVLSLACPGRDVPGIPVSHIHIPLSQLPSGPSHCFHFCSWLQCELAVSESFVKGNRIYRHRIAK